MEMMDEQPTHEIGFFRRVLVGIAGTDISILRQSPRRDVSTISAKVWLLIFATLFSVAEFCIVAHLVFADDGFIHPPLIIGACALSLMIASIDAFVFLRSSQFEEGMASLRRSGFNIQASTSATLRKVSSFLVRCLLGVGLAGIGSLGIGDAMFSPEIKTEIHRQEVAENGPIILRVTAQKDAEITRAVDAEKSAEAHVTALQQELVAIRNGTVNPALDPAIQSAQQEVDQFLVAKAQKDAELAASQRFSADELAGAKGEGHTGRPGHGTSRIAAEERVRNAQAADDAAAKALAEARSRLEEQRKRIGSSWNDRVQQAHAQLPALEKDLDAATERLAATRQNVKGLIDRRKADIRTAIENAPEYISHKGFLSQLSALRRIAEQDPEIAAVILLIDISAMALELSMVIATSIAYTPTIYAPLLAKDIILREYDIADALAAALNDNLPPEPAETEGMIDDLPVFQEPANDNSPMNGSIFGINPFPDLDDTPPDPPKRPRGRPRKSSVN